MKADRLTAAAAAAAASVDVMASISVASSYLMMLRFLQMFCPRHLRLFLVLNWTCDLYSTHSIWRTHRGPVICSTRAPCWRLYIDAVKTRALSAEVWNAKRGRGMFV